MPGDFSRSTFDSTKHYSGVLMQQGRVQLDADWNEQLDIAHYRTVAEAEDVIGASGVPKKENAFKISAILNGADLLISSGRMYVAGLLCELENTVAATYFNQPYYINPDNSYFTSGPQTGVGGPTPSPASPVNKQLVDGSYVVYIDAWQREISHLDDHHIQEVALGEADTTTRLQTVWQVKLLRITGSVATDVCKSNFKEWQDINTLPTGKLNARTIQVQATNNPCLLPSQAGYQSLENQLYRIEIHKGGNQTEATFKWSRENASVETTIEK